MAKAYLYSLTLGIIIILSILSSFNLKYSCDEKLSELKVGRLLTYEFKKPNGKTFKVYKDKIIDIKSDENPYADIYSFLYLIHHLNMKNHKFGNDRTFLNCGA